MSERLPEPHTTRQEALRRIRAAITLAAAYGGIAGDHHKAWVIDQMVRELAGPLYERIVAAAREGEDGPDTYDWDVGVPPWATSATLRLRG